MEHKHTPGPWTVNGGDDVWIGNRTCVHIGDEDDARLIAAAPDLLEVLKSLLDMDISYRRGPVVQEAVEKARAAIAKATGEPQ